MKSQLNTMMKIKFVSCLLLVMVAGANADGAWKWGDSPDSPPSTDSPTSADVGEQVDTKETAPAEEGVSIDEATDAIITSTRTGKVINSYGAIYEDPSVQEALKSGNDTEARTYIKSKLCNLGLAKECALLPKGKTYGYGGHSLGIDPLSVSYVQPVQLVAAGAPIAAIPLGGGIGGFKNNKGYLGSHSGHAVPSSGLSVPALPTYGAPALGNSYGTPPLSPTGGLGFAPPIGGGLGLGRPVNPVPYSPPAPVYTKTPVYNPPAPAHIRPPTPVYNPAPPAYNPATPIYNPAPLAYNPTRPSYSPSQLTPAYSNPSPSYSGLNVRDTCVCVPIQQCPSYDIVGRVNDYQLDPRNLKSNITAAEDDLPEKSRRRRQNIRSRRGDIPQTIADDDSNTSQTFNLTEKTFPSVVVTSKKEASTPTTKSSSSNEKTEEAVASVRDARQLGGGGYQTCGYQEVCCRSQKPNQYSNIPTAGTCGRRNPSGITGRIKTPVHIDGEAEFGEYPWQVAILKKDQYDNVYVCGGALVGPSHVITAAHCIKGNQAIDLRVRLGEWDVNRESEFYPHVEKDVSSILIHPEFYQGNLYNDIALVKFDGFVDFQRNPHISQACLPPKYQEFAGSRCWVTGWGKDAFGTGGKFQNILKEVDVPVINNYDCENKLRRTRLGYDFKLDSGFMCAGGEEGKDACKGDGGGPLVCEHQGQWYLGGIVSWGIGCGQYDVPGVYTKVSQYTDWVQKNMFN